jgi:hypothetical protein
MDRPPKRKKEPPVESKKAHHPPHADGGGEADEPNDTDGGEGEGHHCHNMGAQWPMFATSTVAVCRCGAGCMPGDVVGEL